MGAQTYKPRRKPSQGELLSATDLLVQSTHGNVDEAHIQVRRAQEIVAHARELMARARLTVGRSRQIQNHLRPEPAGNPPITPKAGISQDEEE